MFKPEFTLEINQSEKVCISGDLNDFNFDYYIYSEAFQTWIRQDLSFLEKHYDSNYKKLLKRIETLLLREGSLNESVASI